MTRGTSSVSSDSDRSWRLTQVVEDVVRRRAEGTSVSDDQLIEEHPDLMPELWANLVALRSVEQACSKARSSVSGGIPNASFPGCEIVEEIYRGGQGVVYRAKHQGTARDVAVKVMREGPFQDSRDRARFEREVRILAQLKHPNIVTIHDSGCVSGHHYFVMDYIEGEALDVYMASGRLTIKDTLVLFLKICRAINAAHLRGIIHRDLKPSNIRIDKSGEPYILDFGLAKLTTDGLGESTQWRAMTMTGQFVGSLPWASPEQAGGSPDRIDLRTDVYSLGVVLYQMLTARFPYDIVGNIHDVLSNIIERAPVPPRTIRSEIDEDVATIVLKCLAKEPEHRYQNAAAVADDVERYLTNRPILARAPSTIYQLKKLAVRHKLPFALVTLLLVLVMGFAAWMSVLYQRADRERQHAIVAEQLASREARTATAVRDFLVTEMLLSAAPEIAQGEDLTVKEVLENASAKIEDGLDDEPVVEASVRTTIGQAYLSLGLHDRAEAHLRSADAILARMLGSDDPETLVVRNLLVDAMYNQGRYGDADSLALDTLTTCRRVLGDEHATTFEAAYQYARLLWSLGHIAEAEALHRSTLESRRRMLGEEHPDTIASLIQWGMIALIYPRKTSEAEVVFGKALETSRRVLGEGHPMTLLAKASLGWVFMERRNFVEGETMLRNTVRAQRRILGDRHPDTIMSTLRLGELLLERAFNDEAEVLFRQALKTSTSLLGSGHPVTCVCLIRLAKSLSRQRQYDEATPLLRQALAVKRSLVGIHHAETASIIAFLGSVLTRMGKHADAESLHRQSLDIMQRFHGDEYTAIIPTLKGLVRTLAAQGKFDEARIHGKELLEIRRQAANQLDTDAYRLNCYARALITIEPPDLRDAKLGLTVALRASDLCTDDYHYNRYTLARAYRANGQYTAAVDKLHRALSRVPLEVSEDRHDYQGEMVSVLEAQGDLDAARQIYAATLARRKAEFSEGHLDIASSLEDLGSWLLRHHRHVEAEPHLRECLTIRQSALPASHWSIGHTKSLLGAALAGMDELAEARPLLAKGHALLSASVMADSDQGQAARERLKLIADME